MRNNRLLGIQILIHLLREPIKIHIKYSWGHRTALSKGLIFQELA